MRTPKTTVVKIGSESLENFSNTPKVAHLVDGIARQMSEGVRIILVSSGAVSFGRRHHMEVENRQVLAALGWHHLLAAYSTKFRPHGISIAGFLVTHADIEDREERAQTFIDTIHATWEAGLLPVINENDPLSTEEMREVGRGADNDKNALLLARLFRANTLVLITNTNGTYEDLERPDSRIKNMKSSLLTDDHIQKLCQGKSLSGTGGMRSKLEVSHEAGKYGITTHIGNGVDSGIHDMSSGGTTIIPG